MILRTSDIFKKQSRLVNEIMNLETETEVEVEIMKTSIEKTISLKFLDLAMLSTNFKLSAITVRKKNTMQKSVEKDNNSNKKSKRTREKSRFNQRDHHYADKNNSRKSDQIFFYFCHFQIS